MAAKTFLEAVDNPSLNIILPPEGYVILIDAEGRASNVSVEMLKDMPDVVLANLHETPASRGKAT